MADIVPVKEIVEFYFDVERPIAAIEVAKFLTSTARDYKKSSGGRTLAVVRVQEGSLIVELQDAISAYGPWAKDAAEVAKGAKAIIDFGQSVASAFKLGRQAQLLRGRKDGGFPTADAAIQLADKAHGSIRFKRTNLDGSVDEAIFDSEEIAKFKALSELGKAAERSEEKQSLLGRESRHLLTAPTDHPRVPTLLGMDAASFASALSNDEMLIETIVLAAQNMTGGQRFAHTLIDYLQERGRNDLADRIVQKLRTDPGFY